MTDVLKNIYQDIRRARQQKNWSRIRDLSKIETVRKPTRPNLEILAIIVEALGSREPKSKEVVEKIADAKKYLEKTFMACLNSVKVS